MATAEEGNIFINVVVRSGHAAKKGKQEDRSPRNNNNFGKNVIVGR